MDFECGCFHFRSAIAIRAERWAEEGRLPTTSVYLHLSIIINPFSLFTRNSLIILANTIFFRFAKCVCVDFLMGIPSAYLAGMMRCSVVSAFPQSPWARLLQEPSAVRNRLVVWSSSSVHETLAGQVSCSWTTLAVWNVGSAKRPWSADRRFLFIKRAICQCHVFF